MPSAFKVQQTPTKKKPGSKTAADEDGGAGDNGASIREQEKKDRNDGKDEGDQRRNKAGGNSDAK